MVEALHETVGIESVLTGINLHGDNIHGSNERVYLPTLQCGIATLVYFFLILGDQDG